MDNFNTPKRYIFKKDYQDKMGTINEGSQLDVLRTLVYYNGGMCDSYSSGLFNHILNTPSLKNEYLKEVVIPYNKL